MPRKKKALETTDFSFADNYIEDMRVPKWWRIKVKYPYVEDRNAISRIPFESEELRRSFRGKVPQVPPDYSNLTTKKPETLADSKYLFRSSATNKSNVPPGYYGTTSGIFPIDFEPFTVGEPLNKGVIVNYDYSPETVYSGGEFYFVMIDNYHEINKPLYIPVHPDSLGVMPQWKFKPEFENPTYPKLRYPRGAIKR
jgi:hypothetical protein